MHFPFRLPQATRIIYLNNLCIVDKTAQILIVSCTMNHSRRGLAKILAYAEENKSSSL
jgi:hypothetical protein